MTGIKKYCETHHFYYRSQTCPLCDKERIGKLEQKHVKKEEKEKKEGRNEIIEEKLNKLMEKFNVK